MATTEEIHIAFRILISAGLRETPDKDRLRDMLELYQRHLQDVDGRALIQAADDLVNTEDFWPSLKKIRAAAYQVKIHNFTSAAPNHWKDGTYRVRSYDWCAKVGADGHFYKLQVDATKPRQPEKPLFPPEVLETLDAIEEETGGVYAKEQYDRIDAITRPYLELLDVSEVGARREM